MGHKNVVRGIFAFFLVGCIGLTVTGNLMPVMYTLVRTATGSHLASFTPWKVCELGHCQFVTNESSGCTELTSRLRVMAAFSVIHVLSCLVMFLVMFAEYKDLTLPIRNLNFIVVGWVGGSLFIVWPLVLSTWMAKMCGNVSDFKELGGTLADGFYFLVGAFGSFAIGGTTYVIGSLRKEPEVDEACDAEMTHSQPLLPAPKAQETPAVTPAAVAPVQVPGGGGGTGTVPGDNDL